MNNQQHDYVRFTQSLWDAQESKAFKAFEKSLGDRPTSATVGEEIPNMHKLDVLNRLAIIVLIIISVYTGFKAGMVGIALAEPLKEAILHEGYVDARIMRAFIAVGAMVSVLSSTFSIIYFKLLNESRGTIAKREQSATASKLSLEWISPRVPLMVVYASIAYVAVISVVGNGNNIAFWLFSLIVLLMELGLTYPVGLWLSKSQKRAEVVADELQIACKKYDSVLDGYENNTAYLRLLYREVSESFYRIKVGKTYPNEVYRSMNPSIVQRILKEEYNRLRGGFKFANEVQQWLVESDDTVEVPAITELSEPQAVVTTPTVTSVKRVPMDGKKWSGDTLWNDLIKVGAPKDISQKFITQNYAPKYGARPAWHEIKVAWGNQ